MSAYTETVNAEVQVLRRFLINEIKKAFSDRDCYCFSELEQILYVDCEGSIVSIISIEAVGNQIGVRVYGEQGVYIEPLEMQTVDTLIGILQRL